MPSINFSQRSNVAERMDTEVVSFEDFRACLKDLAWVNQLTAASRPTLAFLDRLLASVGKLERPLEIVDVGSGYGDVLRDIHTWAIRRGLPVSLTGIDLNPWSARAAKEATRSDQNIQWITEDAFAYQSEPGRTIDVIVSSLFAHHLEDSLVAKFLRWMESTARLGWFVNDLHRSPVPYHVFRFFSKAAGVHRFVQHDGPVSIARAFTKRDWERLLRQAQIAPHTVEVSWQMPFRMTLARFQKP